MPSSASSPYNVVITFDADTTIVISHYLKSSKYMQFPSKNQKYKRRPDSEIHESETVAGFLSQQLWPNRLFRLNLQVSQPTSQAENQPFALLLTILTFTYNISTYLIYLRRKYFSVTYTGTIPMELFNVKKVGFFSVQLKRFKRNCQNFRIMFETILIR